MPLLDLQLRLRQLGTLRMGELVTKNGKTYPTTRDTWRVTTSDPKIAEQIARLYGGTVSEFESKSAEALCVDTTARELPIAVVPGHALTQYYELWSGGGCQRRCDGVEELIHGGACVCDPDSDKGRECKPTTRLSLVIRGIDALGLFRLNTGGWYAASELGGAVQFLEQRTARGEIPEGWLRIEDRVVVRDGQTMRFKVPVLDVAYGLDRMLQPTAPQAALPAGYTPLPPGASGPTLAAGLAQAETQTVTRTARSAAPIPATEVEFGSGPVPVPAEAPVGEPQAASADSAAVSQAGNSDETPSSPTGGPEPASPTGATKPITKAQKDKLNTLVGQLRDRGELITTEQLWAAIGKERNLDSDMMVGLLDGRDPEGVLHWAPLRDSLDRAEANSLIGRLETLEQKAGAA